jgi:pyruvate/2-oxoglutarate dehydrogenase complex dihydrolipoamide acyltransferase (E2) component
MAVAPAGQINDAMLLRVPPASIKALGEYGQMLAKRGVGYNMVVTKVGFDLQAESPKLTFSAVGLLDDEGFAEVQEIAASDIVSNILGSSIMAAVTAEAAAPTEEAEEEAPAPKPAAKPKAAPKPAAEEPEEEAPAPKPAAKPKAKPAPVVDDMDLDLDGINFDD